VLVGETHLHFFDLKTPRKPARWPALPLPEGLAKTHIVAAGPHPPASTLANLSGPGNQGPLYDISASRSRKQATTGDVLPETRIPLVRDMQFSTDGETLWIVSGDNLQSIAAGSQPTRLSAVRLLPTQDHEGARIVSVWRTMAVPGASAPLGLAVSRG